ncbi:MAG: YeeE/YedE thiosulfate transporter family protein [Deltaproteobacteria bacterium]|nr:YeeE/YedE thiosulfate transporter family protein [Deltaproteobacteria bacterium]
MMPFYQLGSFDYMTAMALATVLGVGFGFVLERAGFSRATNLAAQFYGRDNRVLKVMFSAIATATVGLGLFGAFGIMDLSALSFPSTLVGPLIVGGLLLGVGFVVAGYCPGTAVVATASGNVDGLITFVGVMAGSILFAVAWPAVEGFYFSGDLGVRTFPELLDLPWTVIALIVVAIAVVTFFAVEKLEAFLAERDKAPPQKAGTVGLRHLSLTLATLAGIALIGLAQPAPAAEEPAAFRGADWSLLKLGNELVSGGDRVWVVDLRPWERCTEKRIPGAICRPKDDNLSGLFASLPATRELLLYGEGELAELPPGTAAFAGHLHALSGGFEGFARLEAAAPALPADPSPAQVEENRRLHALHAWLSGAVDAGPPPTVERKVIERSTRKGGGC